MSEHWARKYIGKPYRLGARGPLAYDCWGLMWLIYRNEFDILLPEFPGIAACSLLSMAQLIRQEICLDWKEVEQPFDGCGVAMSQQDQLHHVGVYTTADRGLIVHCAEGEQTVAQTPSALRLRGYRTIKFYRHFLWPT